MSSLLSRRTRYPASRTISTAGSDRDPLLGTATRTEVLSEVGVDVVEVQTPIDHHHLQVVEQLADLLGQLLLALVLGRHPDLCGLLDHLLADGMGARVEL